MVKVYEKGVMSRHIHSLKVGDSLDIKGPLAKLPYVANKWKSIGMVAGGTGITPMLQVIDQIVTNPDDQTEVTLLFANTSSKDILLKEKIDAYLPRIKVVYVCDKTDAGVDGVTESGYVTKALLEKYMPAPAASTLIYTCGPPGFMNIVSGDKNPDKTQGPLIGFLSEMGYDSTMVCKQ